MTKKVVWAAVIIAILVGLAYPKYADIWFPKSSPAVTSGSGSKDKSPDKSAGPTAAPKGQGSAKAPAPLRVSTYKVAPRDFAETISATGTVLADEGVELQAETNGKITRINFVEGAPVKKGDLLVKLNDSDLRANLDRYSYSKKLAEVRFRRYEKLFAQKVISQDDYDNALSEMNVQQSFIDLYKAQIEKTEIRAPFDGVVGLRYVSLGTLVTASTRIATLQRLDNLKIDFAVPEKYSGRIKAGRDIRFTVAGGLRQYDARIYAIDPKIDSNTRTLLARAISYNNDGTLLPGAFTSVSIELEQLTGALLIPAEAVIAGLDEKNVFVIEQGVAVRRSVETGSRTATEVHIVSGLQAGDQVITSGLQQMRANQPVESLQPLEPSPNPTKDRGAEQSMASPNKFLTNFISAQVAL
jgi:membrane fusion protein (multidrug efflux system)